MKWTSDERSPFGRRQRRARGARLPVTVVTGFLGAGKTTLIRALLERPEGEGTAVVVNEFGEIGIDQALLRSSSEETVLLGNGCVCCTARSDLQETLRTLFADRARGAVPSFRRVVIETSGLADPAPVLQTFATDRALGGEFHLQAMVAVVDAVSGIANLERMPEAQKQVALADRIVLTKTDIVGDAAAEGLRQRLAQSSAAPVRAAVEGRIDADFLLDDAIERPATAGDFAGHAHSHGISSFSLIFSEPLPWPAFAQAMAVLRELRGPDLLRAKGILAVEGCRGPVVVHFVQHTAHPPVELEAWPDDDRRSRLVFVTRGLERDAVAALFAAVAAVGVGAQLPHGLSSQSAER